MSDLSDDDLKTEYQRLTKLGWNRAEAIASRRKSRHEKIDFDNPKWISRLQQLEKEMESRGLK